MAFPIFLYNLYIKQTFEFKKWGLNLQVFYFKLEHHNLQYKLVYIILLVCTLIIKNNTKSWAGNMNLVVLYKSNAKNLHNNSQYSIFYHTANPYVRKFKMDRSFQCCNPHKSKCTGERLRRQRIWLRGTVHIYSNIWTLTTPNPVCCDTLILACVYCCQTNNFDIFHVLLTVQPITVPVNNQLDAQFFFIIFVYYNSLHVSSNCVLIIRRVNCINTTSGICHSI